MEYKEINFNRLWEDALESYSWMFESVTPREKEKLAAYVDDYLSVTSEGEWHLQRRTPLKWAFIRWKKTVWQR